MRIATSQDAYLSAERKFDEISDYLDSAELAKECRRLADLAHQEAIYAYACEEENREIIDIAGKISALQKALSKFEEIPDYRDSSEKAIEIKNKIEELNAKIEARKKLRKKITAITVPSLCAAIAFVILLNTVIIPNGKYNYAIALMNDQKYTEAISAFTALDDYKDSINKIEECNRNIYGEEVWNKIKNIKVGDTYNFGTYEQDNNKSNGQEEIEWLIFDKQDTKILLISKYALDCKQYNENCVDVTWETSTLRQWFLSEILYIDIYYLISGAIF